MLRTFLVFMVFGSSSAAVLRLQRRVERSSKPHRPKLVVMAALHGTGSTMLSSALNKHPCIISIGEPFSADEHLYAPDDEAHKDVITVFRNHTKPDRKGTYRKLMYKLNDAVGKPVQISDNLQMKSNSILDFFRSVRKAACDAYDLPKICDGTCVFVHKLFPDYISDDFEVAREYLMSSETAVIHLHRNEASLAESNQHRFNSYSALLKKRDRQWNEFLFGLRRHTPANRIWKDMKSEDLFDSASSYMEVLQGLFRELKLDSSNMTGPVQHFIDRSFEHYGSGHRSR